MNRRVPLRGEGITKRRRRLRRPLKGEHALGPGFAGELVGFPAYFSRALGRNTDRGAVKSISGFGAHCYEDVTGRAGFTSR
jgi:hypothetical protein